MKKKIRRNYFCKIGSTFDHGMFDIIINIVNFIALAAIFQ